MDHDVSNCYVCSDYLGPFKNKLIVKMEASGKTIGKLLESLLDITIDKHTLKTFSICQSCFIKLERYEDLQKEAESIQEDLINHFNTPSHSQEPTELIQIKIESPDDNGEVKVQCPKCFEEFSGLGELNKHLKKDCEGEEYLEESESDEDYEEKPKKKKKKTEDPEWDEPLKKKPKRSAELNKNISKDFKAFAQKNGVDYSIESFHRAFGAPPELNKNISKDFKEEAQASGVDYSIESFQRAFGSHKESEPKSDQPKKKFVAKNPQRIVEDKKYIAPEFAKTLERHGINYNLQIFHRVFGFSDQLELPKKTKPFGFKCSKCGEEFDKLANYTAHARTHTVGDFSCEECQMNFQSNLLLDLHLSSDHGRQKEGPFVCPRCLKSFLKKDLLRSHLTIHAEERKFLCTLCGASFIHRKSFQMHAMMHDDIRPYECNVCSKRFRSTTKLNVHMRIHTGERKYECPHCPGKTFRQKWGMDLHIKKIHLNANAGDKICQICNATFQLKSKLRQHLSTAHQVANLENYGDYDEDQ